MGAVVEIWFKSLIPFLLKDSHIVQCGNKPWLVILTIDIIKQSLTKSIFNSCSFQHQEETFCGKASEEQRGQSPQSSTTRPLQCTGEDGHDYDGDGDDGDDSDDDV